MKAAREHIHIVIANAKRSIVAQRTRSQQRTGKRQVGRVELYGMATPDCQRFHPLLRGCRVEFFRNRQQDCPLHRVGRKVPCLQAQFLVFITLGKAAPGMGFLCFRPGGEKLPLQQALIVFNVG
ncbi:hypothetical protein D3C80_781110 [compost metagenome]